MYRCEICRELIVSGTPSHRVVVETRKVVYPPRQKVNRPHKHNKDAVHDRGGAGTEIAKSVIACPRCAGKA